MGSIAEQLQQKQQNGLIEQPRKDSLIKTESSQSGDNEKDLSGNVEEENKIEQLQNKYPQILKENSAEDIQVNKEEESKEGVLTNGKVSLKSSLAGARLTKSNNSAKKVTFKQELYEIIGKESNEPESQEEESNSENQYYPSKKAKETHKKDIKRVQKDLEKQRKQFEDIASKRKLEQAFPQNYNQISKILKNGNEVVKEEEEVTEQQQDTDKKIPKKQKKQAKNGIKKVEKVEEMNENKIISEQIIHTNKEIDGDDSKKDNKNCVNYESQQNYSGKIDEEFSTSNESSVNSQVLSPKKVKSARLVEQQELKTLSSSLTDDEKKLENNFKKKYNEERKAEEQSDSIQGQLRQNQEDEEPEICKKQEKSHSTKNKQKLINDLEMNQTSLIPQMKRHSKNKFRKKVGEQIKDEELNPDYIDPSLRFINKKHFFQSVFDKYRPSGRKQFFLEINQAAMNEPVGKITDPTLVLKIFHAVYEKQKQVKLDNTEHENEKEQQQQNENIKEDTIQTHETTSKQEQIIQVINDPVQAIQQMQKENDEVYAMNYPSATYLNSDLRYLNFDVLLQKVKSFDIVYMDPPWRIKGGQMYDSQFMFSNNKFSLEYDTMSNKEIGDIQVEKLSKKGFMFLWILNTQLESASIIMQKWGYTVIDKIIWIKMKSSDRISLTHGYYFMHSFEMCVVGYKDTTTVTQPSGGAASPEGSYFSNSQVPEFYKGIANNVIFAEVRKKSQKPDEFYELMELLVPGAKKIELFARNNNLRPGWLSIGNQLGENYEKWKDSVKCDICRQTIEKGKHRYKSKKEKDFDVCNDCFKEKELDKRDFFFIENNVSEDVLHEYQMCNHCKIEPMWGIKFECKVCKDYDLCEACIDLNIASNPQFHDITHDMNLVEVPLYASGFQAHDRKCIGCYRSPIVGPCVTCFECNGAYNLCQKCYFSKPVSEMLNKNHKEFHTMQIIITPIFNESNKKKKIFPCVSCRQESKEDTMFKCENCFNFYMCFECMAEKGKDMKAFTQNTHKPFHKLVQISVQQELKNLREPPQVHNQTNQEDMLSEDSLYEEYDENGEVIKHAKVEDTLKITAEEEDVDKKDNQLEEVDSSKIFEQMEGINKENEPENHKQEENLDNTSNSGKSLTQEMIIEAQKAVELICKSTKKKVPLEEINSTVAGTALQFKVECESADKSDEDSFESKKGKDISFNKENDELSLKALPILKQSKSIAKTDINLGTLPKRGRGRPKKQPNPSEINPEETICQDQ